MLNVCFKPGRFLAPESSGNLRKLQTIAQRLRVALTPFGICALIAASCTASRAAELPAGFIQETLADRLNAATAIAAAPDGRIFIAEQTGLLRLWKDGRLLPVSTLDLSQRVDTYWERGLIGVTLHPDFPRTPHLFILYVAKSPFPHHVVSRFVLNGDVAESERVLLEGDDQTTIGGKLVGAHQGGPLRFGADGTLYLAIGEQTARQPAQSLASLQGKVLRINADGSIPNDNPFAGQTDGTYRSIWAIGLRNPFGLAVQPKTGRIFVTDEGEASFEEVNEILPGANYGWPEAEGVSKNPRFKNPLHAYPPLIGRSICGATFYPEHLEMAGAISAFPEKWRGKFFFSDWAAHWVKALDPNAPDNVMTFGRGFNGPVAVEVAPDGSLLVLNRGTIWRDNKQFAPNTGSLIRIRYTGDTGALTRRTDLSPVPQTLRATGLFASLSPLVPREAFIQFEINAPPWQPGARAIRWISIPAGKRISISADGDWRFPAGAVVVQHYQLAEPEQSAGTPFETHVFWFNGPRSARAAAYRWATDASEAAVVPETELAPLPHRKRHWFSPGIEENLNLDTVVAGFVLPMNTRQLSRDLPEPVFGRPINQLALWSERGWLDPSVPRNELPRLAPLDEIAAPAELRVRSYLDVNCSACHRPGGFARSAFDARFGTALAQQGLINGELIAGDLGIAGARVIVPGSPEKSVLYQRLKRNDFFRMPPGSTTDEPTPLLPVLDQWIRSLP